MKCEKIRKNFKITTQIVNSISGVRTVRNLAIEQHFSRDIVRRVVCIYRCVARWKRIKNGGIGTLIPLDRIFKTSSTYLMRDFAGPRVLSVAEVQWLRTIFRNMSGTIHRESIPIYFHILSISLGSFCLFHSLLYFVNSHRYIEQSIFGDPWFT